MKKYVTLFVLLACALSYSGFAADVVHFVSVPILQGQSNKAFLYTAVAVSSDPTASIHYSGYAQNLMGWTVVEDFTLDSITGKTTWIPPLKGDYKVSLIAKSNKGGTAQQIFVVSVAGGNGIIQGKVTDTLDAGIPNIIVEAFNTINDSAISFAYAARTDANGNYRISRIDPGSYKLRASSPGGKYESQWYEGKRNVLQADVISIADSPSVTIANFKLRSGNALRPKITVTGSVTDTTGSVISGANCRVVFVRAEFALNFGGGPGALEENFRKYFEFNPHGDFRLEGNSEFVFKTRPDSLTGEYQIQLPAGRYIAFARANGYATEFFQESPDLLSADKFFIPSVLPVEISYDFTLAPLPPIALGSISGVVKEYDITGVPVQSRVIAFRDRWRHHDSHSVARAYVTDTDSLGAYSFDELLPGSYVVLAIPLGRFAPSFYTGIDSADHRWKRAKKIDINGNSVDDINIYVKPLGPHANGYTSINGTVTINVSGGGMQGGLKAGAIVYAANNGWISGYAFTGIDGNYSINGLAPGEYTVFVDKPGFDESSTTTVSVGYAPGGAPVSGEADFTVNLVTSVTGNTPVQPAHFQLAQNYPNPFNPSTTIDFQIPDLSYVSLKVYDLVGREVVVLVNEVKEPGSYSVEFRSLNLASGVYFYALNAKNNIMVRKMLLIK